MCWYLSICLSVCLQVSMCSYRFSQLKCSSDDGKSLLRLEFHNNYYNNYNNSDPSNQDHVVDVWVRLCYYSLFRFFIVVVSVFSFSVMAGAEQSRTLRSRGWGGHEVGSAWTHKVRSRSPVWISGATSWQIGREDGQRSCFQDKSP